MKACHLAEAKTRGVRCLVVAANADLAAFEASGIHGAALDASMAS
jgi:hypothetical protein